MKASRRLRWWVSTSSLAVLSIRAMAPNAFLMSYLVCASAASSSPADGVAAATGGATAADAATDPETTGSDVQEADDEPAPQEPAAEPDTSDDGRPAWASGNY